MAPTVTVCVPTIGRTATLRLTLASLKAQSWRDYEVLILDNASPADTQEEIASYLEVEARASVMRSTVQLPMFENFQRGIDASSGRYICFFHDDDVYAVDFLAEHSAFLDAHPAVSFSGSNCTLIDGDGRPQGNRRLIHKTVAWQGWRYVEALFALGSNIFPMQSVMFRRDVLDRSTFTRSTSVHFGDFVILMRLAEEHEVGLISRDLLQLRSHNDQASRQLDLGEALTLRTAVFSSYCDELAARWPSRRSEIEKLRRRIGFAHRSAAVWSWLNANDARARDASKEAIGHQGSDQLLRLGLGFADRIGIGRFLRASSVRSSLRNAGVFFAGRLR